MDDGDRTIFREDAGAVRFVGVVPHDDIGKYGDAARSAPRTGRNYGRCVKKYARTAAAATAGSNCWPVGNRVDMSAAKREDAKWEINLSFALARVSAALPPAAKYRFNSCMALAGSSATGATGSVAR